MNPLFSASTTWGRHPVKRKVVTGRRTTAGVRIFRSLGLLLWLFAFQQAIKAQDTVAFYFSAHEDDWQLFMNPNAYNDVHRPSTKVVFVYLTAGDAGAGLGNAGRLQPYYLARENGAKLSVKFLADAEKQPYISVSSAASLAGHPISKWTYGNTVSYFLRLPDGNPQGTGYATTGTQSLKHLRDGTNSGITAIDSSTTYRGWNDLTATLRALIDQERGNASSVWVNLSDTDTIKNAGDHEDHLHTAKGVLEAVADLPCINKAFYLDYITEKMPVNMTPSEREIEAGTFGALVTGLTALDHNSPWDKLHRSWLSRHYFRTVPGTGKCATRR
jgi:hypothetical protein